MQRFFGMMPSAEIEKEKTYHDRHDDGMNMQIRIQAGPHGWTVIWADGGTNYKDVDATTEENFNEALAVAKKSFPNMRELNEPKCYCVGERVERREEDGEA